MSAEIINRSMFRSGKIPRFIPIQPIFDRNDGPLYNIFPLEGNSVCPLRLVVRTQGFHPCSGGSIPPGGNAGSLGTSRGCFIYMIYMKLYYLLDLNPVIINDQIG